MNLNSLRVAKAIVGLGAGLVATSAIEHEMMKGDTAVEPPIDTVSIIIPSYNEEKLIELCLSSLKNQSVVNEYPDYFEYILVDSQSTDNTVKLAEPYVDRIINAPRGKLNARVLATNESRGNIIVSTDSDTTYDYTWLNTLLKPLQNPSIAGVTGSTIDSSIPYIPQPIHTMASLFVRYTYRQTQMVGRNSAYWKHLFYMSGGFNTDINQKSINEMLNEEEIAFGKRLSKLGRIYYKLNASCTHLGGEKIACRLGLIGNENCKSYGFGIKRFG